MFINPVAAISCLWPCSPKHFLNPPTVWGLRWCNWMVCPPSQGLVSLCLPLSPIASPHVCLCWMVGVSAFPRSCLPLSPLVSPHVCLCWMVCPPSRLISPCLPLSSIVSPHVCLCWMVGVSAFPRSCLPLSPLVSPHVCLCLMVCPPSRGFISSCLHAVSPHMCAMVVWCVRFSEVLSFLVSHCLPLSPHVRACGGWCVRLPEVLSLLVSLFPLSPSLSPSLSPGLSPSLLPSSSPILSPSSSLFLFPFVAGGLILHFSPNSVCLRFLMLSHVFEPVPQNTSWIHPLFGVYGGVI